MAEPAARRAPFGPVARSAFRVLGLAAGASQREAFDAAASVRLALKVGVRKSFDSDLAWLGPVGREESDVRDAVGRLSEPSQRAFERLFWFDEPPAAAHVSNVEELERAVSALSSYKDDAPHDAALLALAGLVRLDPELGATDAWARAFALWRRVFDAEEFWSRLVAADLRGDFEQLVTYAEVRELRANAPRVVSHTLAERARDASVRGDARECGRALALLRVAGLQPALLEEYEREALGPLEDSLTERVDAAFGWLYIVTAEARGAATVRNYANEAWQKFKAVTHDLSEFVRAAGASHYSARRVLEHAASKLLLLSERFGEALRREESLFVALKAHALAPPASEASAKARARLRALGASEATSERSEDEYAAAVARELSDAREPEKLFKNDSKGEQPLDTFLKTHADWESRRVAREKSNLRFGLLTFAAFVFTCFALQHCGGLNTRPTRPFPGGFPLPTYTPFQLNLNYNHNLNLNIQPYTIPTPLTLKESGRRTRGRKGRANRRDSNANAPNNDAQNGNALKWPPPAP
ncbi:MAG TPA: hypothetical protein VM914_09920 [Pyrinomonadaceae bacterium]|nr:hypothetical protein [Pyrinomonadaceae bacterium]